MRFPLSWLKEYLPNLKPDKEIKDKLEEAGLEIEEEISLNITFKNIFIGEILEIQPHPFREHLLLTKVKLLNEPSNLRSIVCGAHNIKVGDFVPVAIPGSTVEGKVLEAKKIGGVLSEGMLLSLKELGFAEDLFQKSHEGIFIIDQKPPNKSIEEILGLPDKIWEIKIFPNRSDLLSIKGMARDISIILNIPFINKIDKYSDTIENTYSTNSPNFNIEIENHSDCSFYSASIIDQVTVKDSPYWIKIKLLKCGLRPINNIVDITNYVMLELGQPLHAFDYSSLNKDTIIVRRGKSKGEKLITLDEVERTFDKDILLITTIDEPIGIAGIIGGLSSGISNNTKKVVLESANFSPEVIRQGKKKLNISTDASYRFERGLDVSLANEARNLTLKMFKEVCDCQITSTIIAQSEKIIPQREIVFSLNKLNKILGTKLNDEEVWQSLKHLKLSQNGDSFTATIPSYRKDLNIPEDIYEEVARIIGYTKIPSLLPNITPQELLTAKKVKIDDLIRDILCNLGLIEVVTFSMISEDEAALTGNNLRIINPLSSDLSHYRSTLLPGLLQVLKTNLKYDHKDLSIFEIGHVYNKEETNNLAILSTGRLFNAGINKGDIYYYDFYVVWGYLKRLANELNIHMELSEELTVKENQAFKNLNIFHPYRKAFIKSEGETIGYIGEIHPKHINKLRSLSSKVYFAEIDLSFIKTPFNNVVSIIEPSRFPHVERHLSFTFPCEISYNSIIKAINLHSPKFLEKIYLIDRYFLSDSPNRLSFTISFTFRASDHTLREEEIKEEIAKIVKGCLEIGGELRGNLVT